MVFRAFQEGPWQPRPEAPPHRTFAERQKDVAPLKAPALARERALPAQTSERERVPRGDRSRTKSVP